MIDRCIETALQSLQKHQAEDGHLPADYGGPLFLLPALLIVDHIVDFDFSQTDRSGFLAYTLAVQNEDGGFGLHQEGPSTIFGTTLNYVALRCLGRESTSVPVRRARQWIADNGGVHGIPVWGKVFLAILNIFDWEAVPSLAPEMWALPKSMPAHPSRLWCHTRAVYMPMSYLYARRYQAEPSSLILSLRDELFSEASWTKINWRSYQNYVAKCDALVPIGKIAQLSLTLFKGLEGLDKWIKPGWLRRRGMAEIKKELQYQDSYTNYLTIGPISKVLHSLIAYIEHGRDSLQFKAHLAKIGDYIGENKLGLKMKGYNGSQLWDATFAYQAIHEALGVANNMASVSQSSVAQSRQLLDRLMGFIKAQQLQKDPPDYKDHFQEKSKGGWPFSTQEHGWMISDCTAEAIKCVLLETTNYQSSILPDVSCLLGAVDRILDLQAKDGGWSEYERPRSGTWIESLNSSQLFEKVMVSHSHVECTATCMDALVRFNKSIPDYRWSEIARAVENGLTFLSRTQLPSGGFYGNWGICYTYGTWFGVMGMISAGVESHDPRIYKAISFLLSKQASDGGWAEDWRNSQHKTWHSMHQSYPVQTAWAMMTITSYLTGIANTEKRGAVDDDLASRCEASLARASEFLCNIQNEEGDWMQPALTGSFNGTCTVDYENYARIMPLWALATYRNYETAA